MQQIVAFIKFNHKTEKKILFFKDQVKNTFGNQPYLNHPVHSTLFSIHVKNWKQVQNSINNLNFINKNFNIKINKTGIFKNDIFTNGHTTYFKINKNIKLSNFQIKLLESVSSIAIKKKEYLKLFKANWMKKNYLNYGFPYTGENWIPHITIASIKNIHGNNIYFRSFLKNKINLVDQIKKIEFYRVANDKHKFLFDLKLY